MGNQTQYSYNEAGWRTGETWLNSQNQVTYHATYTYDNAGELIAASDNFSAFAYSYDVAGNRTQQAVTYSGLSMQPLVTLNYAYDGIGHRTSFSDSLGGEIDYLYSGGQMDRIELSLNGQLTPIQENFLHDDKGLLARVINPDGTDALTVSHDAAGRVTEMNYGASGLDLTYAYNAGGEVTSYAGPEGTINYNYDTTGQLTGSTGAQTAGYAYDANGNRTMTGYQTGPDNELLSDGTYTYTYNQNGQLVTKTDASGNVWTYTWDNRGRMVEVSETGSQSQVVMDEKIIYDVNNNLIGTMVNGTLQRWTVWDGKNPYLEFDGTGNVTERYVTNPDTLNAFYGQVSASGQAEFYLSDQENSVRMIVDASGNVLDQISYDAYGKIVSQTNASNAGLYLFQGGACDANLGLYHFGARWYDPNGGRWLSQDPMSFAAGDSNLYRFVSNSPTNATDPSGRILFGFIPTNGDEFSAFGGSFADSYNSMTDGLAGTYMSVAPTWAGGNADAGSQLLNQAYETGPLGQTQNGAAWSYYGTRGALTVATTAVVLVVIIGGGEFFFMGNRSILLEGRLFGGRLGSGGVCQIRPQGGQPWFRLDWHRIQAGGRPLPHIDAPPFGWHHWPWQ